MNLAPGEELVLARVGGWQLLVPMRHVAGVHGAALPAAVPPLAGSHARVALRGELVPVVFGCALTGGDEASLRAEDKLIELVDGLRRALLWVDAVEDVVAHEPVHPPSVAAGPELTAGFSGPARPLPVIDVPRLLDLTAEGEHA